MKLEDCTKEELVWWLRKNLTWWHFDERNIVTDVLFRRQERMTLIVSEALKAHGDAMNEYRNLLAPYAGHPSLNIPREIIEKGAKLEEKALAAWEAYLKATQKERQISDQIDKMLEIGGRNA